MNNYATYVYSIACLVDLILLENFMSSTEPFITLSSVDAIVDVLPISALVEGSSESVCVMLSSPSADIITFTLTVTLTLHAPILSGKPLIIIIIISV